MVGTGARLGVISSFVSLLQLLILVFAGCAEPPCPHDMERPCHLGGAEELICGELKCLPSNEEGEEPGMGRCGIPCVSNDDCKRETQCTIDLCVFLDDTRSDGHCAYARAE